MKLSTIVVLGIILSWLALTGVFAGSASCHTQQDAINQQAPGTYQMTVYATGTVSWIAVMDTRTSEVRIKRARPCKLF